MSLPSGALTSPTFPMRQTFVPTRLVGALLVLVIAGLWFADLSVRVLQHPDEGRYAEIAREMAATGDWLTPRLDGLKYFEKPPLQYWLGAATFDAFGVSEWTARLWPALCGALAVVAMAFVGWSLGGAALAWSAGLVLAGTVWHVALSQILTLDAMLACWLAIAFAALVFAQRAETSTRQRRAAMCLAWAALAAATLTKGLIGVVIPGAAVVLYTIVTRDIALWRRLHLGSGLLLYFALAAPWFVLVSRANPEFAQFFFVHEHVQRFLTTEHRRTGTLAYFVPLFCAGALPWLTVVLFESRRAWREGVPNALGFSWQRLALVWAGFVFVFFSVSSSKLPSYILPMYAPLALVVAWRLLQMDIGRLRRHVLPLALVSALLAVTALGFYPRITAAYVEDEQSAKALALFGPWVRGGLTVAAAGPLLAVLALRRRSEAMRFIAVAAIGIGTLAAVQVVVAGVDSFRHTRSAYDILERANAVLGQGKSLSQPDIPFYQIGMYDQTVPFYVRRTTILVEFDDELALGLAADPRGGIPTIGEWMQHWRGLERGYALMTPAQFERFGPDVPMRVLARDSRRVVVSRQ